MHGRVHVHWHAHTVLLGGPFLAAFFAPFLAGASFLPNCAGQAWAWDMSHGALELCVLAWEWSKEYFTGAHGDGPGARGGHAGVNNRGARRGVGERASQREAWSKAAWSKRCGAAGMEAHRGGAIGGTLAGCTRKSHADARGRRTGRRSESVAEVQFSFIASGAPA